MRKRRNKKKRKAIMIFGLLLVSALILGFVLIQNFGKQLWQKPSNETIAGSTIANTTSESSDTKGSSNTSSQNSSNAANSRQDSLQNGNSGQSAEKPDEILDMIDSMTLEEKIGQLVIVGVDAYENNEHSRQLIEQYHVGGFILFKKNIQDSKQMLTLLNSLKVSNSANKIPLFLSIDEEGGRISRMPDEFLKLPSNKEIGKLNNAALSYQVGSILGEELSAFGFNVDFAPVMDINSNPKNPVIGDRSFGTTAELVSKLGVETMKGIQSQNVISVVKHFPGHGDTSEDSHIGLPRVRHGLDRLESFELKPFKAAIENNVDAIMIAHILLPKIDSKNPASFSKTIISNILRTDMKFDGVVITDDFTMGAIIKNYNIGEAAVKSIKAGSDIVLVCHEFDKQEAVIQALQNAADTGAISIDRINQSVYRILKLKGKYKISDENSKSIDPQIINDRITELFSKNP